ncbi:hypothetical protein CGN74_05740 [Salmonella enterica]|nr:hypothetical protein [Salmonella enterica]EAX5484676.1 hypothetical protein [Salmonella enterica]EAY0449014.1 hypothetical protein [Salmonella enterica]EAZ7994051.1 hypothetical protein [Salmonella enterica]EBR5383360.1 hypothetical protein [Salmonella enterica]
MTSDNENPATSKKQITTEYFIDKKLTNKNIPLVDSFYIDIYSIQKQKRFMNSLQTITSF